jgi:hypothetical protein
MDREREIPSEYIEEQLGAVLAETERIYQLDTIGSPQTLNFRKAVTAMFLLSRDHPYFDRMALVATRLSLGNGSIDHWSHFVRLVMRDTHARWYGIKPVGSEASEEGQSSGVVSSSDLEVVVGELAPHDGTANFPSAAFLDYNMMKGKVQMPLLFDTDGVEFDAVIFDPTQARPGIGKFYQTIESNCTVSDVGLHEVSYVRTLPF